MTHPRRPRVIPADLSQQRPSDSYAPLVQYEDKRLPCTSCGRSVLWTANAQRQWYEETKASIYAQPSLRCATCRTRGRHDHHKHIQRSKARKRYS